MKKDLSSFNVQLGVGTELLNKFQQFFIIFCLVAISNFSAQEVKSSKPLDKDAAISIVGEGFIYSKDKAFNDQVSANKTLQNNSKITEVVPGKELHISSKDKKLKSKPATPTKRRSKKIKSASKEIYKYKSHNLKKDVGLQISNKDASDQLLAGSFSGKNFFISTDYNPTSSKYFICYSEKQENISLVFLYSINYFYKNRNSKLQVFTDDFSVRPPPSLA